MRPARYEISRFGPFGSRRLFVALIGVIELIFTDSYSIEFDEKQDKYKIKNYITPICPDCGQLLSGYDTRRRHIKDDTGTCRWFLLRRLRCIYCNKLHLEAPSFMKAKKHYDASVIDDTVAGLSNSCPADNSTIRRWKQENNPPSLPLKLE